MKRGFSSRGGRSSSASLDSVLEESTRTSLSIEVVVDSGVPIVSLESTGSSVTEVGAMFEGAGGRETDNGGPQAESDKEREHKYVLPEVRCS